MVYVDVLSIPFDSALFYIFVQAVVHVVFDMIVVERDVIFVFARCEVYRTSTMPSNSFICRHHAVTSMEARDISPSSPCWRKLVESLRVVWQSVDLEQSS